MTARNGSMEKNKQISNLNGLQSLADRRFRICLSDTDAKQHW